MRLFFLSLLPLILFACSENTSERATKPLLSDFTKNSYRSLKIINDSVILAAGTNGQVFIINPFDSTFNNISPSVNSAVDFRSAAVLNDSTYLIAPAGSPGYMLRTSNKGLSWDTTWINNSPNVFIDGMQFANEETGWAYGDILDDYLLVLKTTDGGLNWDRINQELLPPPLENEGSFAASNSGILVKNDSIFLAYSSPNQNRLIYSYDKGITWQSINTKMRVGEAMGTFAMDFSKKGLALVGGSFVDSSSVAGTGNYFTTLTDTCLVSTNPPTAYCSGIACIGDTCLAVGRSGSMLSKDGGKNWEKLNSEAFYTVRSFKNKFYLAGKKGRFKTLALDSFFNETY